MIVLMKSISDLWKRNVYVVLRVECCEKVREYQNKIFCLIKSYIHSIFLKSKKITLLIP